MKSKMLFNRHMLNKCVALFIFSVNFSFAQDLYVGDNSYLFAKDVVVFVNDDIRLETATSNLYMRGDAQLIQNTNTKNSDEGELSIYQNQTTGIYEYNYFCSPVGVSIDGTTKADVDFDGSNIRDPDDDTDLTNVVSTAYSYTSAYNGTATELSNYWLYTLKNAEGYNDWVQIFDTGAAAPGYGFTLKGSPNTNNVLDFRGRPNNGTITVDCTFDGADGQTASGPTGKVETLTGNPYPSTLDLKLFFANSTTNQANLSGEIFFWEQKTKSSHYLADYEGGYAVYIPGVLSDLLDNGTYTIATFENYNADGSTNGTTTGSTSDFSANNSRRFAAVGQGFVVHSDFTSQGGVVTFDNTMRLYLPEDSTTGGDGAIFAKDEQVKGKKTKKEIVAKSHNGVNYKSILETPTIIPEIRIHTHIDNTFYKENVIAFRGSTPDNNSYNRFYDGASVNELSNDAYIISNDKALSIKSINYDESTRLTFGLKASKDNTVYNIKINALKDVSEDVNIFIFDKISNTYTDIKNNTFDIILDEGIYNNRFEITFNNNTLNTNEHVFENFKVFQNNKISQLNLLNPKNLNIKSFSLLDVSGKQVITDHISSNKTTHTYNTKSYSDGVYIAKISLSNNQVFTKKVIITN
ncbi:MAG: T9SS type A sorting domain-containing protein [Algibacter sp.]